MTHGISGYVLKCRCRICRRAWRDYQRQRNQNRYDAGQCRSCDDSRMLDGVFCDACREKSITYQRAWRAAVKADSARLEAAS